MWGKDVTTAGRRVIGKLVQKVKKKSRLLHGEKAPWYQFFIDLNVEAYL